MTDALKSLRDVAQFAYANGYHEHGVDLVGEVEAELDELARHADHLNSRIVALDDKIQACLGALRLIDQGTCERLWSKEPAYRCSSESAWTKDATYTADRWCDSCIAHEALEKSI